MFVGENGHLAASLAVEVVTADRKPANLTNVSMVTNASLSNA
jgi:hypothetical protein